ncbi:hypothetical protein CsSME_00029904 [Camellia sinensis var. sinensis]
MWGAGKGQLVYIFASSVFFCRSVGSASEAAKAGIPLDHYQDTSQIDFAFNDADIIEERTLISLIGHQRLQGEESIIQEKNILNAGEKLVFIVTEKQ